MTEYVRGFVLRCCFNANCSPFKTSSTDKAASALTSNTMTMKAAATVAVAMLMMNPNRKST